MDSRTGPDYRLPRPKRVRRSVVRNPKAWLLGSILGLALVGAFLVHDALVPHLGRASQAAILAEVPPDLLAPEARNVAAERRFVRFARLTHEGFEPEDAEAAADAAAHESNYAYNPPRRKMRADYFHRCEVLVPKVQALLAEGPIQAPSKGVSTLSSASWRPKSAPDTLRAALKRGDRRTCIADALWQIRLDEAFARAGETADATPGLALFTASWTIYDTEMQGGYGEAGRRSILRVLRPCDGPDPILVARLRRFFRETTLPKLLRIAAGEDYWRVEDPARLRSLRAGRFDPVDTARLMSRVLRAELDDLASPFDRRGRAKAVQAEIERRFRDLPPEKADLFDWDDSVQNLQWRMAVNRCPNSLGAHWAVETVGIIDDERRNAAHLNLVVAVLRLRSGITTLPVDPYGHGPLRFDPRRHLVWSVGQDGIDDGAPTSEQRPFPQEGEDIVYRY